MSPDATTVSNIGEFELISRVERIVGSPPDGVGIGDDCAVVPISTSISLLATADTLVDGVHFRFSTESAQSVGRRAIAVNASDVAAMAGRPWRCLVSLALGPDTPVVAVEELYRGIAEECRRWGISVVGGNVTSTPGPLSIDVTLLATAQPDSIVLRRGARPGDVLAVTGSLGARAALRLGRDAHLSDSLLRDLADVEVPVPRVIEALGLAELRIPHAMLDLSDGLSGDIRHLCSASEVGAQIDVDRLPLRRDTRLICDALEIDPIQLALSGGEDYELMLALDPARLDEARDAIRPTPLTVVGHCVQPEMGVTIERNGIAEPLPPTGWQHF